MERALRQPKAPSSRLRAFSQVAVANVLFTGLSFITSPITAHVLEPAGRGELAAVLVPYSWSILLFGIGLPTYAARAAASEEGVQLGTLLGTMGVAAAALGLVGILIGVPLAGVLAGHNALVHRLILIGLLTLPVSLMAGVGIGVANGLEQWHRLNLMRVLPPLLTVAAYVVLVILGSLTVTAAAVVAWSAGLVSVIPLVGIVRRYRPLSFDRRVLRTAFAFGSRAWVGTLASNANYRLDQLIMIPLVVPRQLGLYAVAVNVSMLDTFLVSALSTVIGPSVARGNRDLIARAVRVTIAVDAAFGVGFGVISRWLLPIVFGARFADALPMVYVLLAASVPGAAAWILGSALQNAGQPGVPALGEIVALVVTVAGLIILLPALAGLGAAIVSGAAYSTNAALQIGLARRRMGIPVRDMLVVRRSDIDVLIAAVRSALGARFGGGEPA